MGGEGKRGAWGLTWYLDSWQCSDNLLIYLMIQKGHHRHIQQDRCNGGGPGALWEGQAACPLQERTGTNTRTSSSSHGAHTPQALMCQALCWVMLGPRADSNAGLPCRGDRYNYRRLRSGTSAGAGSGLTPAQGAMVPKGTEVGGNQESQVQRPQEEHISKSLKAAPLPYAARAVTRPSGC